MKLRSITLDNVRRFSEPVTVGPIGDGVTLLCEPNEAGKSTLFDALHALFYLRHGSQAADVKALRPHSGGRIAVECTLDHEDSHWRIRKEWLSGASAKVWQDGRLVHQGEAAEDWIAALVAGRAGGPAGLLWVRQGRVALQAGTTKGQKEEFEKRRDLLTAISGAVEQVTGGDRMDRIHAEVAADLARLQTKRGAKAGGRWAEAEATLAALREEEAALEETVAGLRSDLDARRRLQARLAELTDPETVAQEAQALTTAEAALKAAERRAQELEAARSKAELAQVEAMKAQEAADRRQEAREDHARARDAFADAEAALTAAETALETALRRQERAARNLSDAQIAEAAAREITTRVEARAQVARAQAEREELTERIKKAEEAEKTRSTERIRADQGPDAKTVERIEALARDATTKRAVRDAAAPRITAHYLPGARPVTMADEPLTDGKAVPLAPDGTVQVPGIGHLCIATTDTDAADQAERARAALDDALAQGNWSDLEAMHKAAREAAEAARAVELAGKVRATLAPQGIDALRNRLAHATAAPEEDDATLPDAQTANAALEEAASALKDARNEAQRADAQHQSAAVARAEARAHHTATDAWCARAAAALEALPTGQDAQALEALAKNARSALKIVTDLETTLPDVENLRSRHARLAAVAAQTMQDTAQIRTDIGKLEGRIETLADKGVEEELEKVRGQRTRAQEMRDRVVFEKDTLARLQKALETAQHAARETYFRPVATELRPLLSELWEDAELQWSDETLLPTALVRRGTEEPIDVLSGGTQEQIAFLVRLAFARLLAQSGRHAPLILDDALVYSDDDRIERMFDALHRAAQDLQIIVLSCRQRAFGKLGAPSVSFGPVQDG